MVIYLRNTLIIIALSTLISCSLNKNSCFKKVYYKDDKNMIKVLDSNYVYRYKEEILGSDSDAPFINPKRKSNHAFRFFSDNKFNYYYNNDSISMLHPSKGYYIAYNDTIQICLKYNTPQAGVFIGKSFLIVRDSILIEYLGNNSEIIYLKTSLNKFKSR